MMRKIGSIIIACIILLCSITHVNAAVTTPAEITAISVNTVLLYEAVSGCVLYEKNARNQTYPASTTKILTAIIVIDLCEGKCLLGDLSEYFKDKDWFDPDFSSRTFSMDDVVTVTDPETRGSTMHIRNGEALTVRDLMYGMMLISGNDCARALAIYFSPAKESKVTYFAELMNAYARELGAKSSNFVVPHGLHVDEHMTTAYDMALITEYALKNPTFRQIVATETYTVPPTNKNSDSVLLENTNRLIHTKLDDDPNYVYKYPYAVGVKTGDTDQAGKCLVAAAEKDGMQLICVLFGDQESISLGPKRYEAALKLFNYGFDNFKLVNATELGIEQTINCNIEGADVGTVQLNVDLTTAKMCLHNEEIAEIKAHAKDLTVKTFFNTDDGKLHAPLKSGDVVGYAEYSYGNEMVLSAELTAATDLNATDGKAITGVTKETTEEAEETGNEWIFWLMLAALLLVIVLVIIGLTKQPVHKKSSQLGRKKKSLRRR